MEIRKEFWEKSYTRNENYMFYPKEESVSFLNRFVKKRLGIRTFKNLMGGGQYKGLDFGCGIGRITALINEFEIEGYGIDISENAILEAKKLLASLGWNPSRVCHYDGEHIPFKDDFFDFCISEGVLDSMPFELAKKCIKEIERVSKKYFYLSLIGQESIGAFPQIKDQNFKGEIIVDSQHEFGTIQSFFDLEKIKELIKETRFKIAWIEQIKHENLLTKQINSRYHIVLDKEGV